MGAPDAVKYAPLAARSTPLNENPAGKMATPDMTNVWRTARSEFPRSNSRSRLSVGTAPPPWAPRPRPRRSEEHTSELQSRLHLVCRLLLEKKKNLRGRMELLGRDGETLRPRSHLHGL